MSSLDVLANDGFQALEERQSAWTLRRLDSMLLELQDMDEFLTDLIERQRRRNPVEKASISV